MRGLAALFLIGSAVVIFQAIWPYIAASSPYFVPVVIIGLLLAGKK